MESGKGQCAVRLGKGNINNSARPRKRPSTRSRSYAPRASSDAPSTSPLKTSGLWPRCSRPTIVLQTRSARGRPCDRHHSRTTSSESRCSRASESLSPASCPTSTNHPSQKCLCARQVCRRFRQQHQKTCGGGGWRHDGKPQLAHERHLGVVPPGPNPTPRGHERHPEDLQGPVLCVHPGAPRP